MTVPSSIIGVDLGGTKTTVALFDEAMRNVRSETFATRVDDGFPAIRQDILDQVQAIRLSDTKAIGIGVAGLVDRVSGRIVRLPNIPGADGEDFAGWMRKWTGLPVRIGNDAQCFTFAEAIAGPGKGQEVVVGIAIGTGIGGGIVIDGKLFHGEHGFAGEMGHMLLQPGRPPYRTRDVRGDAEQFLSGRAMGRRCPEASDPHDYLQGETCDFLHPNMVSELAWLLTSITHCVDPSIIVLGGSAGRAFAPYLPAINAELRRWLLPGVPLPMLVIGTLPDAAVRGAAMLACTEPPLQSGF